MRKPIGNVKLSLLLTALLIFGSLFVTSQAFAEGKKFNIRFSTWHVPAGADVQKLWIPMLEEMKKRSNGRLDYTMYAGGALGKGLRNFKDGVKEGDEEKSEEEPEKIDGKDQDK